MSEIAEQPLVSIITTSYNYGRYIGETVSSVLNQTYQNWELIVVDDCSSDNSVEVLRVFKDPRINLIVLPYNSGAAKAFAAGFTLARGKYMISLDSDDYIHPYRLERQVGIMEKSPELDILGSYVQVVGPASVTPGEIEDTEAWFNNDIDLNSMSAWVWRNQLNHSSVMLRSTLHDRVGNYDDQLVYTPDYDFWVRCCAAGIRMGLVKEKLTFYRIHGSNITHGNRRRQFEEILFIFARHFKVAKINMDDSTFRSWVQTTLHHQEFERAAAAFRLRVTSVLFGPRETLPNSFLSFSSWLQEESNGDQALISNLAVELFQLALKQQSLLESADERIRRTEALVQNLACQNEAVQVHVAQAQRLTGSFFLRLLLRFEIALKRLLKPVYRRMLARQ